MKLVLALALLFVGAVVLVVLGWPLDLIQWGILGIGLVLLSIIAWGYVNSPPMRSADDVR